MQKTFADLPLIEPILKALQEEGYTTPTPIQADSIEPLLEGRDLLGCAQTGTGKTAAFSIPILQQLAQSNAKPPRFAPLALVLAPTRELAVQIHESFETYGRHLKVRVASCFGGVGQKSQVTALQRGTHVLVATPGRLMDLIEQGYCQLDQLTHFVLDEADRMLDMGFLPSLKRIIAMLPENRQSIFLSATMPPPIEKLAADLLRDHVSVMITPPATTAQRVAQSVLFVDRDSKKKLLVHLLEREEFQRVLVFVRTKYGAERLAKQLRLQGFSIDAIHGDKSQNARQRVLKGFRDGEIKILVATDVAARGIDVDGITHVINFDIPVEADGYVHRIGRTARAGATGISLSMCDATELELLRDIEKEIQQPIPVDRSHPYHSSDAEDELLQQVAASQKSSRRGSSSRGGASRGSSSRNSSNRGGAGRSRSSQGSGKPTAASSDSSSDSSSNGQAGRAPRGRSSSSSNTRFGNRSNGQASTTSEEPTRRKRTISGKVKKVRVQSSEPRYGFATKKKSKPRRKPGNRR